MLASNHGAHVRAALKMDSRGAWDCHGLTSDGGLGAEASVAIVLTGPGGSYGTSTLIVCRCRTPRGRGQGTVRRGGGRRGLGPKSLCTKSGPRHDFPNGKFRFFPRWSLWSGGGGGVGTRPRYQEVGGSRGVPPLLLWCTAILILLWTLGTVSRCSIRSGKTRQLRDRESTSVFIRSLAPYVSLRCCPGCLCWTGLTGAITRFSLYSDLRVPSKCPDSVTGP